MWFVSWPDVDAHQFKFLLVGAVKKTIADLLESQSSDHLIQMLGQNLLMKLEVFREEVDVLELKLHNKLLAVIFNLASWYFQVGLISRNVETIAESHRILEDLADGCY